MIIEKEIYIMSNPIDLNHLFEIALEDTSGSKCVAMVLLSLWNGSNFKVDMQELLYLDTTLFEELFALCRYLKKENYQLSSIVNQAAMNPLIEAWGDNFRSK